MTRRGVACSHGAFLAVWVALVLLFGPLSLAMAQSSGISGFTFLQLEPSARAAAMAGSYSAAAGTDVNGLFYNPALLNEEMHNALSLSYLNHIAGINAGFLVYARDVQHVGTLGAGVRYLGWGDLRRTDETGQETGTFGASDVALTVGISWPFNEHIRYGANIHTIYSHIESYSASAIAADLGVLYHLDAHHLTLAFSVNNLGRTMSRFAESAVDLPLDVRISAAKRLRHVPLLFSITGYNLDNLGDVPENTPAFGRIMHFVRLGGELLFSEAFQVRLGYNHRRHAALATRSRLDLAGLSLGAGLKVSRVRVDYAYNSWSEAGSLHQFTVRTTL